MQIILPYWLIEIHANNLTLLTNIELYPNNLTLLANRNAGTGFPSLVITFSSKSFFHFNTASEILCILENRKKNHD